ncbi:MAG: hypothetical protein QM736_22915 [Vicinamibacterales bacterium]
MARRLCCHQHADAVQSSPASTSSTSTKPGPSVGASELLRGHLPYASFGDNKPPLIYMYLGHASSWPEWALAPCD